MWSVVGRTVQPIVLIVGTRPEGIKMAPVYYALQKAGLPVFLCSTAQHGELLRDVFNLFGIKPDAELDIMQPGQDLFYLTQSILQKTKELFTRICPSLVLVHGDTTSAMASALSAFYLHIPIGHIEAGLRTDDLHTPFPEEMNRRMLSMLATYHFAPTQHAENQLIKQGIARENIFCTGNTIVDALRLIKTDIEQNALSIRSDIAMRIEECKRTEKKIVVMTAHRRELLESGRLEHILQGIKRFLHEHQNVFCFYPYHPNPQILHAIEQVELSSLPNMYVCEPLGYKDMVYLLDKADIIMTDSGGIQEEAVSLGKPVVVLREKTERIEGVQVGLAHVVGTDINKISACMNTLLSHSLNTGDALTIQSVYGNGYAADAIATIVKDKLDVKSNHPPEHAQVVDYPTQQQKDKQMKKVCVIGLGYIGLPTAIVAAEHGFDVIGYDIDEQRVRNINNGDPAIKEPELFEKLQLVLYAGTFSATTQMPQADFFIVAVPTPLGQDKRADLSAVFSALDQIVPVIQKGNTIIIESTVPVGTTKQCAEYVADKIALKAGEGFFVAHCPERVLPGNIFHELIHNDRIIGGINQQSVEQAKIVYKQFTQGSLYLTNAITAEIVKLVENSSRDVQLAFAHQVASMAYAAGLNPYDIIELANKHPRVNILQPSCGVGGHCIAIDPWFLIESFPQQTQLLKTTRNINDDKPNEVIAYIKHAIHQWHKQHRNNRCTVLLLGLTYKANVDDVRESPALLIAQKLHNENNDGLHVLVSDPHANKDRLVTIFGDDVVTPTQGLERADIVVYLVAHTRFNVIDKKLLQGKRIVDFCGILHKQKKESNVKEYMFWPATYDTLTAQQIKHGWQHGVLDFFITHQSDTYAAEAQHHDEELSS